MVVLSVFEVLRSKDVTLESFKTLLDYRSGLWKEAVLTLIKRLTENTNRWVKVGRGSLRNETVLLEDMRKLARYVSGDVKSLCFTVPFTVDNGHADVELREKILKMTPAEPKVIGLRKNTLHYMKKIIDSGRPIRLYGMFRVKVIT